MGFWSTLAKIGGAVAAPFTGGASLALTTGLSAAGSVLGGIADQSAANRAAQGQDQLSRDALKIRAGESFEQAQQGRARLALDQQQGERSAEADAFRKALIARLTQTTGDTTVDRSQFHSNVPTISFNGGIRPSALGSMAGQAGSALEVAALQRLMHPEARPTLTPLEKPQVREAPKASFWEGLAGAAGLGLGAIGKFGTRRPMDEQPADETHGN